MLYFLYDYQRDIIKIGYTGKLYRRLYEHRYNREKRGLDPDALHVMGVMPGTRDEEFAIVLMFREFEYRTSERYDKYLEWFFPCVELTSFIDRFTVKWDGSDDFYTLRPKGGPNHYWAMTFEAIKNSFPCRANARFFWCH